MSPSFPTRGIKTGEAPMQNEKPGVSMPCKTATPSRSQATQARILRAAHEQFVANGLEGTRMEAIATTAGVNKSLVYRHFGSRENLYRAVLARAYENVRVAEAALDLSGDPLTAVDTIIAFSMDYYIRNPDFLVLVGIENLNRGEYLSQVDREDLKLSSLMEQYRKVIEHGIRVGLFRDDLDPVELYTVIASQCWFAVATHYTFGIVFKTDVLAPANVERRIALIRRTVRGYLLRD